MSKYGGFSGRYFPAFGLNTERWFVSLRIQSECGEIRTRKTSVFRHFSRSEYVLTNWMKTLLILNVILNNIGLKEIYWIKVSKNWILLHVIGYTVLPFLINISIRNINQKAVNLYSKVSAISRKHRQWSVRLIIERKIAMLWMDFFQVSVAFLFPNTLGRLILWFILMYIYINGFFRLATLLLFYAIKNRFKISLIK